MSAHESPAHAAARRARDTIDEAVRAFREVDVSLDRAAIADRLKRAIELLYVVLDTGVLAPAHHDALDEAARVLDEVRAIAERGATRPSLALAIERIVAARALVTEGSNAVAERILARRGEPRGWASERATVATRPFRASVGLPQLHALDRGPIARSPSLDPIVALVTEAPARPTLPTPTTLEELRAFGASVTTGALAKEVAAPEPEPEPEPEPLIVPPIYVEAIDEGEASRRIARDCLEDVASLSILRRPIPTESWLDQAPFEQRMLNALDAFASFGGGVLPSVPLHHAEADAPDAARAFAVAFVLGCIEGTDTVDVAVATLKEAAPEERPGFVDGFALASSPAVDAAMTELLDAADPGLVATAVDVLARRGTMPPDRARPLIDRRDPKIDLAIARALSHAGARDAAIELLEWLVDRATDDALFLAAIESLLRRGHAAGRERLREALRDGSPARATGAAGLLCLAGRPADLDDLLRHASASPSVAIARGLGRFGHLGALPTLIDLLGSDDPQVVEAAAESLDRVTGAGLRETIDEPWDLGRASDADFAGQPVPTRRVEKPIADPMPWEAWRVRVGARLDPALKRRAGQPFVPTMIVDELEAASTPVDRRAEAALELAIATGSRVRFSVDDWVARQRSALSLLREDARKVSTVPGGWCFAGVGSVGRR